MVLKIVSPDVIHKSDAGGVMVNLKNRVDVANAYGKILENVKKYNANAKIVGVLVQEMAPQSTETIVGAIKDPQFGQTIMFGLGGIFVELLKDVNFRIAPITADDAKEMITQLKAYPLLKGFRNTPPADIDALVAILVATFAPRNGKPRNQRTRPQPRPRLPNRRKNRRRKNNPRINALFSGFFFFFAGFLPDVWFWKKKETKNSSIMAG